MTKETIFALILAFGLILAGVFTWVRSGSTLDGTSSMPPGHLSGTLLEPSPSPSPAASYAPIELSSAALEIPATEQVRQEVIDHPHSTPPSVLRFAEKLAQREQLARQTPEAASAFFPRLEDCALDPGPLAISTLCVNSAEVLSRSYPEQLKDRFSALESHLPGEIRQMRRALKKLE